tara:strand:+ start:1168 stop:1296 length:129 start_codon:yes stop_codon:yes gene_type:complete
MILGLISLFMKSFAKVSIALEINALFADNYILTSQGAEVSSL